MVSFDATSPVNQPTGDPESGMCEVEYQIPRLAPGQIHSQTTYFTLSEDATIVFFQGHQHVGGKNISIFTSPPATERLTHGCWSPTRPGMLFMARDDGLVDVWDLTDSSYIPSVQLLAAPTRITAMEFLPPANLAAKQQLLAVGDKVGNLHIFEVPRTLWRSATNEKSLMEAFVAREVSRVQYVSERMEIRREEAAANAADEEKAAEGGADGAPAAGDGPNADVELSKEELDALQAEYKEVESKLVEDLGLTEAELPAGYQLPAAK